MNARRLLKLADFLAALPREKFDFSQIVEQKGKPMLQALKAGKTRCGTVGCAIGWMPAVFPRHLKWGEDFRGSGTYLGVYFRNSDPESFSGEPIDFQVAEQFFGITEDETQWLFLPDYYSGERDADNGLSDSATPKAVARHIRKFVQERA
jgi:hypothetical protein